MSFNDDLLRLVDQRVKASQSRTSALGTLATRDTTGTGGTAAFDGSAVAVPVRVDAGVHVQPGDRVRLDRYDNTWVVTGGFTRRQLGETIEWWSFDPTPATTTSITYTAVPVGLDATFVKLYDDTVVVGSIRTSLYITGAAAVVRYALQLNGVDYDITQLGLNIVGARSEASGYAPIDTLPAGEYPVIARWRRVSGTGVLTVNDSDWLALHLRETTATVGV